MVFNVAQAAHKERKFDFFKKCRGQIKQTSFFMLSDQMTKQIIVHRCSELWLYAQYKENLVSIETELVKVIKYEVKMIIEKFKFI